MSTPGSGVTLRDYVERIISDHSYANKIQLEASEKALLAASRALELRLEQMNLFREQIQQERTEYMRRDQFQVQHDALANKVQASLEATEKRIRELEGARANLDGRFAILAIVLSLAMTLMKIFWK